MRTVVITGASDGIGAAAAAQLAGEAHLVLIGRSASKTRAVAEAVGADFHVADFERLDEVRALAQALRSRHERIDVLANNAGGIFDGPVLTADGFEKTFQVNHLAPFLLTHLLLEPLLAAEARIVATSSIAARMYSDLDLDDIQTLQRFTSTRAYANAKLANVLFTRGLHERFGAQGLAAVAFHPGVVATNFAAREGAWWRRLYHGALRVFMTTPRQGGATLAHFIDGADGAQWRSGGYYGSSRRVGRTSPLVQDEAVVRRHWDASASLLGLD